MQSNEVRKQTGLTRKAIEYYEVQGLVEPSRDENGYRNYSDSDVRILKRINLYRQLGLDLSEIRKIVGVENKKEVLASIVRDKSIRLELDHRRQELLSSLMSGMSPEDAQKHLRIIETQTSIYERLKRTFPGYLGQSIFISYRPYLQETIDTDEQQEAFDQYIAFLDAMPDLELTPEERKFMDRVSAEISPEMLDDINMAKTAAIENPRQWLEQNKNAISAYARLKNSAEPELLPLLSIQKKLKALMKESGYYEVAIPLLRKMSPAYDEYYRKLLKADEDYRQWRQDNL